MKTTSFSISLFFTFIFSLFTLCSFAQQPEYPDSGFTNKAEAKNLTINGKKEGKWVEYDSSREDGVTSRWYKLIVYKGGEPDGIVREYHTYGLIVKETTYKNGSLNGKEIEYWSNGKVYCEGYNIDVKRTRFKRFSIEGKLEAERENGVEKRYDKSGLITWVESYTDGKKELCILQLL